MDFYAVLPSNSSPDIYSDNTTSHFKVQLAKRMELHGEWQVALLELHYPNTVSHVQSGNNWIKVYKPLAEETFLVLPGHYANKQDFIFALHEAMTPLEALPQGGRRSVLEETAQGYVQFHTFHSSPEATYEFAPVLAMQLGLPHAGPYHADREVLGVRPINLNLGIPPQLYIYMDVIQEQIVGHTRAPLLRTIPTVTDAKFGSMTTFLTDHPIYFDLKTKSFDTIEINIRTHTGQFMPFEHGTSTVLCHFRPRA